MKIGFTGTRKGMTEHQQSAVRLILSRGGIASVHHGDCIGADKEFHGIAREFLLPIVIHPPEDDKLRAYCEGALEVLDPLPYLARNRVIVRTCDLLVAAPAEAEEPVQPRGRGAWFTIRFARNAGRQTLTIPPEPPEGVQ